MSAFSGGTLMITGGTGSFGSAVLERVLEMDFAEIRVFSRDEAKQDALRHRLLAQYGTKAEKVRCYIGDVRDRYALRDALHGVDFLFHAAAMKQVPACEFFPMEAVRTNVEGTDHLLREAISAGVRRVVCLSTDKAVYPVSAMGLSKALMERIAAAYAPPAAERSGTVVCCTRYGNVLCSRGSVVPLFIRQIRAGKPLTLTDPAMTRFLMTLEESVELVLYAMEHAGPGDLLVRKSPAAALGDLARAVQRLFGDTGITVIGPRHGEKRHETLLSLEERLRAEDLGPYYRVRPDGRQDMNYENHRETVSGVTPEAFTSDCAQRLNVEETVRLLLSTAAIRRELDRKGASSDDGFLPE